MTAGDLLLSCKASPRPNFPFTSTSFLFSLHRGHYSPLLCGKHSTIHFPANRHHSRFVTLAFNFSSKFGSREGHGGDVVTRILRENPTQVERQVLSGGKLVTFREKEVLENERKITNRIVSRISSILRLFRSEEEEKKGKKDEEGVEEGISLTPSPVYLDNIFRDYNGKLYVPEQIFGENLSEEDEFVRNVKELPKMSIEDFDKFIRTDKIAMITSKSLDTNVPFHVRFCDCVIQLKESPGEKSLQKTKWTICLPEHQARRLLEKYTGPQYEIEKYTTSYVGKAVRYPHPVAAAISSRIIAELGVLTALIATASVIIGGYVASVVFAVTSFLYAATLYIVWPLAKPLIKVIVGIASDAADIMWENISDIISEGGIMTKLKEIYTLGGISTSLAMLGPVLLVFFTMVFVIRFTLSRRPKNFRQWDIWQGIEFGQSKPQARVDGSTGVMFGDVAGIDEAVEELQELVEYLKNPSLFDEKGIKPPHGVLLEGPPGCGKTLVAKAIAGEANVPFYQMAGSEFVEVLVGVGSARVRDLFKRAKVNRPSVVFIDEIDALATMRQGIFTESSDQLYNAATQERETTLNQLLIELDGFDSGKGVIFLGATNRKDLLDPALLRPGRFDRKIMIRPPGAKGRLDILKVHARKVKMSPSVDLTTYAKNLPGWSGAKLAQLLQESALMAIRNKHKSILQSDMEDAIDRLTVGPKCVGIELGYQGQCRRATTEVGTAIISHLLRRYENAKVEKCERISLIPRGQTYSQIIFTRLDDEAYLFERRPQLLHRLQVLLGGRAAEEVIYGQNTSKASLKYLSDASWLARKFLCIWNMGDEITIHGEPPSWSRTAEFVGPRLDFEESLYDDYGLTETSLNFDLDDQVARKTDQLINDMYKKIVSILRRHQAAVVKTVKVLLDRKEISGSHIDYILDNYPAGTSPDLVLEEKNPGSLPFFEAEEKEPHELLLSEESSLL